MTSGIIIIFKIGESMKTEAGWGFPEAQKTGRNGIFIFQWIWVSFQSDGNVVEVNKVVGANIAMNKMLPNCIFPKVYLI